MARKEILIKLRSGGQARLDGREVQAEHLGLRTLNRVLGATDDLEVEHSFQIERSTLERVRSPQGGQLELDLFFRLKVPRKSDVAGLIRRLEEDEGVEYACDVSGPIIPAADTPNFTPLQAYLSPAPVGCSSHFAHRLAGGNGSGIKVAVIEFGFNPKHQDLPPIEVFYDPSGRLDYQADHGTAVLGQMAGLANQTGVTGICCGASFFFGSILEGSLPTAIGRAVEILGPGDVINISLQNGAGEPVEYAPDVFAGIKAAVAAGIGVVEAAGNFGVDLSLATNARGLRIWDPQSVQYDDSGAILAGAGVPYGDQVPRSKEALSSYGPRVNAQAWGRSVVTSGYGLLYDGGPDALYTYSFGATSASASVLTSIGACLQGALAHSGCGVLDPLKLRELLSDPANGAPQQSSAAYPAHSYHIGPQPDLQALLRALGLGS